MAEKQSIRKEIFEKRRQADQGRLKEWSHSICQKVIGLDAFQRCSTVYAYADCKREVDTKEIILAAWASGKQVAVPKVHGRDMTFYRLDSFDQLRPGTFGVPEPEHTEELFSEDALMIVPGVAFDRARHRAGYGAGYYDRYLEQHPHHTTVAVAFDFQIVDEVPCEPADICPAMLVTESAVYR